MNQSMISPVRGDPMLAGAMGRASVRLAMGDTISFGGAPDGLWRIDAIDPPRFVRVDVRTPVASAASAASAKLCLQFQVSANEEHCSLTISGAFGPALDLGERVHHYALLTLARRRLQDAGDGFADAAQGWTGAAQLATMLGIDPSHLNIQLYRARAQLAKALGKGPRVPELVERRRGELRLAGVAFDIVRGGRAEGAYQPSRAS